MLNLQKTDNRLGRSISGEIFFFCFQILHTPENTYAHMHQHVAEVAMQEALAIMSSCDEITLKFLCTVTVTL